MEGYCKFLEELTEGYSRGGYYYYYYYPEVDAYIVVWDDPARRVL